MMSAAAEGSGSPSEVTDGVTMMVVISSGASVPVKVAMSDFLKAKPARQGVLVEACGMRSPPNGGQCDFGHSHCDTARDSLQLCKPAWHRRGDRVVGAG